MPLDDSLSAYQAEARKFAIYPGQNSNMGLVYTALGLAGEAGECSNKIKKMLRDGSNGEAIDALLRECGDTLWYLANMASELGVSLADIAEWNLDKLRARMDAGTLRGEGDGR